MSKENAHLIKERILMNSRGLTEAAFLSGMTLHHLSAVVNGHKPFTVNIAARLEAALGVPFGEYAKMDADKEFRDSLRAARKDIQVNGITPMKRTRRAKK